MNKIERMLQELCPEGVEYKKLIDVAEILYGYPFDAKLFTEDNQYIPLIRIRDVKSAKASTYYKGDFNDIYIIKRGDILVGMDGNFNLEKWNDRNGVLNQRVCKIYAKNQLVVINEYLYHLLGPIFKKIEEEVKGGTVKHLSAAKINRIEIPVPPLPIQKEIVRILDHFTELTAELQAELQARQEQYEYYRNELLTFTKIGGGTQSVTWMKMSDLFDIRNGYTPSKANTEYWENGTIPWFRMEDIRQNGRILSDSIQHITPSAVKGGRLFPANSFIIATTATIGEHALIIVDSLANQRFTNLQVRKSLTDKIVVKFLYYYMFIVGKWCKNNTNVSGFASVDMSKFKKLLIPIPSIPEQQRIVDILDKFETLVNDLSQGLPAEIAAVQEQYEYYRNKLLTFKRIA